MARFGPDDALEFLEYIYKSKCQCDSFNETLDMLKEESTAEIIGDNEVLKKLAETTERRKACYQAAFEKGFEALREIEDPDERNILLCYFEGLKHSEAMKTLNMPKSTYWFKHNKAVKHYKVPRFDEELPDKPVF